VDANPRFSIADAQIHKLQAKQEPENRSVRVADDHFAVYHSSSEGNERSAPIRTIVEVGVIQTCTHVGRVRHVFRLLRPERRLETAYEYQT
jgi:hypothetical protein